MIKPLVPLIGGAILTFATYFGNVYNEGVLKVSQDNVRPIVVRGIEGCISPSFSLAEGVGDYFKRLDDNISKSGLFIDVNSNPYDGEGFLVIPRGTDENEAYYFTYTHSLKQGKVGEDGEYFVRSLVGNTLEGFFKNSFKYAFVDVYPCSVKGDLREEKSLGKVRI